MAPGTRLLLEDLSRKFDLSMTPLREAIPVLEGEGFVVQADHRQFLNFCKERGASQAEATIRAHLKRSEEYLLLHWSLTHEG